MSSWRREVHCSYCYRPGHNKRGCPRYKEHVAEGKVSEHRQLKPRRCSYCGEEAHDRRTCQPLHDDKVNTILANRKWIELVLKDCEKNGLGVGTMLKISDHYGYDKFNLAMVVGFEWDNLFLKYPTKGWIKVKNYMGDQNTQSFFYEQGLISFRDEHCPSQVASKRDDSKWRDLKLHGSLKQSKKIKIVSRVKQNLNKVAPTRTLNGGVGIEEWFNGRTHSQYHNKY